MQCAVQQSVKAIFEDPGVKELLAKLYQKGRLIVRYFISVLTFFSTQYVCGMALEPDWLDCLVTEYLIPTFEDYFEDIES